MDLAPWIADYATYLESNGYAGHALGRRLRHLSYLNRFMEARGVQTLEEFAPEWAGNFIDYWINHHPAANQVFFFSLNAVSKQAVYIRKNRCFYIVHSIVETHCVRLISLYF